MTREEFLQKAGILGMGMALMPSLLAACKKDELDINFDGTVTIIGAGAAGLMAGYMLSRYNIDFQILEASGTFGGRVRKLEGFADFPIDLGAEWIHTNPDVFARLIDDDNAQGTIDVVSYNPDTIHTYSDGQLTQHNWANNVYREYKFKNKTWLDFFGDFIVPKISDKILYNSPVTAIDYSGGKTVVTTVDNMVYESDKTIITAPVAVIKNDFITFTPALPANKINALNNVHIPPGIKVFIEFSERFYPDILIMGSLSEYLSGDPKLYYDAAFKKDTNRHVLALFWVADEASEFTDLPSDQAIFEAVMAELDAVYNGQASANYVQHVVQNWSAEPYVQGSYSFIQGDYSDTIEALIAPVDQKLYWAGEAMHNGESSTVHGAGFSGIAASKTILQGQ